MCQFPSERGRSGHRDSGDRETSHPVTRHCTINMILKLKFVGKKVHNVTLTMLLLTVNYDLAAAASTFKTVPYRMNIWITFFISLQALSVISTHKCLVILQ